jgi:hypothetical protein
MPYQKPGIETQRTGLPGTPLGNTNFFIPVVVAKTLGAQTAMSRTAEVSGDTENIYVNGQMVQQGDTLNYERLTYNSTSKMTSALQRQPLLSVLSVSTDHNNPYARQFAEGIDFVVNYSLGLLDFTAAPVVPNPEIDILTEGTGGSIAAGTYDIAVIAVDANNNKTMADSSQIIVGASSATITVKWGKVVAASGYLVYAKPSSGTSAQWSLPTLGTIADGATTSVVLTAAISTGALSLPGYNATQHTPGNGDYVYINYLYKIYNYNSPKRYFDTETVQNDHGIGSEAANAARLVIGPTGIGAGSGSMYIVAPEISTGEITGYQAAIDACESIQELVLMATTSSSDAVNQYLKTHCESMSEVQNAKERFALVSTTSTVLADTDVTQVTNKILALGGSNKVSYVITEGGHPMLNQWQNTPQGYNSINGLTSENSYDLNVAVDGQWHAVAMLGMVSALADPATPPTNKQVFGISSGIAGTVKLWNDTRKNTIAAIGGCVLEDRFGNLMVRHALTISQASVEDSELSIVLAEAYMAKRLRDNHQQFIGLKLTNSLIDNVKATATKTLDGLVQDEIIRSYVRPLSVYQDTLKPTLVYVKFSYKPIYPTNNIEFDWSFDIAG